jgi:hypothetical protein
MLRVLLISLLLSNLAGCASWFKEPDIPIIVPDKVLLNPESLKECEPLIELFIAPTDTSPFVTVLETVKRNAVIYADCAAKQRNSVELLKKFSNSDKETK